MEYYSAIRKDDYPAFAAVWTALEDIMLSEISQAEKDNYHMIFPHLWNIRTTKIGEERDKERGGAKAAYVPFPCYWSLHLLSPIQGT